MFMGIFHRRKSIKLEDRDLSHSNHALYEDEYKRQIIEYKKQNYEKVFIKNKKISLCGSYININSNKTVIMVHGFQIDAIYNFALSYSKFLAQGYNVLLIDQRANGNSGGHFSTLGKKESLDLLEWVSYESSKENIKDIVLYGISMGSSTIGYVADKLNDSKVGSLIMEAGFPSFYDLLDETIKRSFFNGMMKRCVRMYAKFFLRVDIKDTFKNSLANTSLPIMFLHGDLDKEVPIKFSYEAYDICSSKNKKLMVVNGAKHTNCFIIGGQTLQNEIFNFVNSHLKEEKNE